MKAVALSLLAPAVLFCKTREITIPHPFDGNNRIEFFWSQPQEGEGPFPMVVLLHGASAKMGGRDFSNDSLSYWVDRGYIAMSISLPGYGNTDGPKDFSGPYSVAAVAEVITFIREQSFIDESQIAVVGFGIGGLTATLLASSDLGLSYVVSANGVYDQSRHLGADDKLHRYLTKLQTFPLSEEELILRSPIHYAAKMKTPLLLFHRKDASPVSIDEVSAFQAKVIEAGGICNCILVDGKKDDERISLSDIQEKIAAQLSRVMGANK